MTKLLDILLEVLRESKPIKFSEEEILDMEDIYGSFQNKVKNFGQGNLKDFIEHIKTTNKTPYLGRILLKGSPKYGSDNFNYAIEVFLVYKEKSSKGGEYSRIGSKKKININVNSKYVTSKELFFIVLQHELAHARDPKIAKTSLSDKIDDRVKNKEKKDASNKYFKYLKREKEFDAFSSSFANQIEKNMSRLSNEEQQDLKKSIRELLNYLLSTLKSYPNSNLKYKDFDDITDNILVDVTDSLFVIKDLAFDGDGVAAEDFIFNLTYYLNKPSQFKKYVQRLARLL